MKETRSLCNSINDSLDLKDSPEMAYNSHHPMVRAQPQLSDIPVEGSPDKVSDSDQSAVVKGSPVVELSFPPKAPEDMFDVVKHMIFKNPANRSAAVIPESELRAAVNKQLQEVLN